MSQINGPVKKWTGNLPVYDDGLSEAETKEQLSWNLRKKNLEDLLGIKIISRSQIRMLEVLHKDKLKESEEKDGQRRE